MSAHTLTLTRSGAFACVAALHVVLIYAIGVSMGVLHIPLPPATQAIFIPAQTPITDPPPITMPGPSFATGPIMPPAKPTLELETQDPPASQGAVPGETALHSEGGGAGPIIQPEPIVPAQRLSIQEPAYPLASIRGAEEGVVIVNVLIGPDGRIQQVSILKSSGYSRLDDAAVKSVRSWRFKPGTQTGAPVASWISLPIRFQLRS
jgi:protein TonB